MFVSGDYNSRELADKKQLVSMRDSIATRLLMTVFSFYLFITISVTVIHMLAEYTNTKDHILQDFRVYEKTFAPGLAQFLWNVDEVGLQSAVEGILQIPSIVGVKIEDIDGEELSTYGIVPEKDIKGMINEEDNQVKIGTKGVFSGLFFHRFPVNFVTDEGEIIQVGMGTLYSNTGVVIDKVRYGFFFILFNSVVKTIALWVIFLLVSRGMLRRPLVKLTDATEQINLDSLDRANINIETKGNNELKVLEVAFNSMVSKLRRARERTVSLRMFSNKIADFHEISRTFNAAFQEFYKNVEITNAVLYYEYHHQVFHQMQEVDAKYGALNKMPDAQLINEIFTHPDQQVSLLNKLEEDHPVYQHYKNSQHELRGSHFLFMRLPRYKGYLVCLHRAADQLPFDGSDVEYVRSMANEMKIAQDNIQTIREKARMEGELKTAAAVQNHLFPKSHPQVDNLLIDAYFQSASETGGDWYGFITEIQNHLYVLIGDVTGHGTPAALVTATASATCRAVEEMYYEGNKMIQPVDFMHHLNKAVFYAGYPNFLMTFFISCINLETGEMTFSNAGHNFPFLLKSNGNVRRMLNANTRLGFDLNWKFTEDTLTLEEGDTLFFYTDGLIENTNPEDEMWGERRLMRFLKQNFEHSPNETLKKLIAETDQFYRNQPIEDDTTVVICKIVKPFRSPVPAKNES